MAFRPIWSEEAEAQFSRLQAEAGAAFIKGAKGSKVAGLHKQVAKCIHFLLNDPKHPSLKTHKYDSLEHPYDARGSVFEAYAQNKTPGAYRVFWCYGPKRGEITIIAITAHP